MRIRCKNCYKVLNLNEEYCTSCGEHSNEVAKYLKTGVHELDSLDKLKMSLTLFLAIAFLGTGVLMIGLALAQNNISGAYKSTFCRSNSFLITSVTLAIVLLIIYRKELKNMFLNITLKELSASLFIGVLFIILACLLSIISPNYLQSIPKYMVDYLVSGSINIFTGTETSLLALFIALFSSVVVEEIIFRRRLIDAFDEYTMFNNVAIIMFSTAIATLLNFMWIMSLETIIMSLILNALMSGIYIYSNRNIGVNIIIRLLLVIFIFVINLV